MKISKLLPALLMAFMMIMSGCYNDEPQPLVTLQENAPQDYERNSASGRIASDFMGSASGFSILAATTITNDGRSIVSTNIGVSPGTAITGFQPSPINNIEGPGTVTAGLGEVEGTIYAGGPVAAAAHQDAVSAYDHLLGEVPNATFAGVTQLNGMTFTPGVYFFDPSANLSVNGTVYLDFQGNNDALFIFRMGSTLVTMAGSKVVALNNNDQRCLGSNVFWTVGSSATIDGEQFIGNVIAHTTITMTSGSNVAGRLWALNGAVTMITNAITACDQRTGGGGSLPPETCDDFVTGGGSISGSNNSKSTFGVSGGVKHNRFRGNLSFQEHGRNGIRVKSTSITAYTVIDDVTRRIDGVANINGKEAFTFICIVSDNGEPGSNDFFSLELSNGYHISGILNGGNIQFHKKCAE
jgi:hypothetical protein